MKSDECSTLAELRRQVLEFRDRREWQKFHNPKDLALAMSIEVAEILELFRFKTVDEIRAELSAGPLAQQVGLELADVLWWALLLSHEAGIDLAAALEEKLALAERRYPVELARGRRLKYTELAAEAQTLPRCGDH
jgi:NTP pyrophosphatase (non-canonical NTP hydrolase)